MGNGDAESGKKHAEAIYHSISIIGGNDAGRKGNCQRESNRQAPQNGGGRQTVGDDFFHSAVEILIRRSKISAQHSRHVAEILLKERFIEVKLGFDIGHDFGWESAFAIERAARSQAQRKNGRGDNNQKPTKPMRKPFKKEGTNK